MSSIEMPYGPAAVIVDADAGQGRAIASLETLEKSLADLGLEHRIWVARQASDVSDLTAAALDSGYRFVVAVGDDVTVNRVVNGMFRDGVPIGDEPPVLGLVPADCGCDLAMTFGLPRDTVRAVRHLAGDNHYEFDLIKCLVTDENGEQQVSYAHNLAEIGMGGHVARRMERRGRSRSAGPQKARFSAFWLAYLKSRPRSMVVECDTKKFEGKAWNVVIGNGQFTSGGIRLSPRSYPGDGVLDALIFDGPRANSFRLLPQIFQHGDHIPHPDIHEARIKIRATIESQKPLPVVADGIVLGTTPAAFQVLPQKILLKL